MDCVYSMSRIGFPPKTLNLVITFQDMKRRTTSSLKRQRAAITVMYRIGEHTTRFKTVWCLIANCAICWGVGLVMVVSLIAQAQIFRLESKSFLLWMRKKKLKRLLELSKQSLVSKALSS